MKDYPTEIRKSESRIPAIPNMVRDSVHENSLENISPDPVQSTLPRLDLPQAAFESEDREEIVESLCTDETAELELKMLNFELYFYIKARLVQNLTNLQYSIIIVIGIDYC